MQRLIIAIFVGGIANVSGQGTIVFNNRVVNAIIAPIYSPDPSNPGVQQFGNTINGFPAGTTVYRGTPLAGTGFTAQLWCAPGANQPESSLHPAGGYSTSAGFYTAALSGFWVTSTDAAVISGAAEGSIATLQVRVWDNQNGTIATWGAAQNGGSPVLGASLLFNSLPLGGASTPPSLVGFQSFSLSSRIPEPPSCALVSLGVLALLILRKNSG